MCVCFPRSTRWPVKITAEELGCWENISSGSPWSSARRRTKKPGRRVLDRQGSTVRTAFTFFFLLPFAFLLPQRWCEDKHVADCKMTLWSRAEQKAGTSLTHAWASCLLHTAGNILSMAWPEEVCPAEHPHLLPHAHRSMHHVPAAQPISQVRRTRPLGVEKVVPLNKSTECNFPEFKAQQFLSLRKLHSLLMWTLQFSFIYFLNNPPLNTY